MSHFGGKNKLSFQSSAAGGGGQVGEGEAGGARGVKMEQEVKSVKITAEESMPQLRCCVCEKERWGGGGGGGGKKKVKVKLCSSGDRRLPPSAAECHAAASNPRRRGRLYFPSRVYRPHECLLLLSPSTSDRFPALFSA